MNRFCLRVFMIVTVLVIANKTLLAPDFNTLYTAVVLLLGIVEVIQLQLGR